MNQNELTDKITAHLEEILPASLKMLEEMVGVNSFTYNIQGINQLARLTAAYFAPLGFKAEYIDSESLEYGDHLVLTKPGRSRKTIGMVSHLDTVFPAEEEAANDFHWRVEEWDGEVRLYGPGTVDIKGGTVIMHMLLSAIRAVAPDVYDEITWVLLLDAAEEAFNSDFGPLCIDRLPRDETLACLVFEGGYVDDEVCNVVVARKGMLRYRLRVDGRGSHAGSAHARGANAIVQMAEIVQKIHALTDYDRQLTFNVGVFHGGTVVNRVPHAAVAEVECRTFSPEVLTEAMISMRSLERYSTVKSVEDGYPCTTHVEKTSETRPWPRNAGTDELFDVWTQAAELLGRHTLREERGGLSDGNFIWNHVPTLDGLGASGANAHCSERSPDGTKDQEYALRASFVPKAALNALGILRLIESSRR